MADCLVDFFVDFLVDFRVDCLMHFGVVFFFCELHCNMPSPHKINQVDLPRVLNRHSRLTVVLASPPRRTGPRSHSCS